MSVEVIRTGVAEQAAESAARAARAAGLTVNEVDDVGTLSAAAHLMDVVWSNGDQPPLISASTLKALAHSGGYVSVASLGGEIVGALVGFLGLLDGRLQLHSHILGVSPTVQGRSIGFALKQHQRAWALARDIATISWTFDALVRRNAYFNLTKLGASITAYYENFYGAMTDAVNAGDESDRVFVEWDLASRAVSELGERRGLEPDVDVLRKEGATVLLEADDDERPLEGEQPSGETLLIRVPGDIVAVRAADPGLARAWRQALRDTLGAALARGYVATGMSRNGWYVLSSSRR
ncbi:MAG TPA: GNAT family N-acetyltransferase [Actinomycetota bacterium]|nr:GNAT family N-acetyltransferase [Actinomycetota bacterium]